MPRLKVYRTAIGFHDAYVAAPSQKAALAAWGVDKNLFARGAAEVVDDPALTREPLARPGKVVRKSRGSLAEQLRALDPAKRKAAPARGAAAEPTREKPKRPKKRPPAPSRAKIEAAESAVAEARAAAAQELAALRLREQRLAEERRALERRHEERNRKLAAKLEAAREAYQVAFDKWSAEIDDDDS